MKIAKVNSRNDYIATDDVEYRYEDAQLVIPAKFAPHPRHNAKIAFGAAALPVLIAIIVAGVGMIMGNGALTIAVMMLLPLVGAVAALSYNVAERALVKNAQVYDLEYDYFNKEGWFKDTYNNILTVLDNDATRDDFLTLLKAMNNRTITREQSREIYKNIRDVSLVERNVEQNAVNSIAEKYAAQSDVFKEITSM